LALCSAHHNDMPEQQLDLFSAAGIPAEQPLPQGLERRPAVVDLDDQALIAAIPASNLGDSTALAAEAARRRLAAAIPALAALCRRFAGFGIDRVVPEQSAALRALAVIGSRDAAQAVSLLIVRGVVQGPTLGLAVTVAAQLHATLPVDVLRSLLRHADPDIRANACRCACRRPELIAVMIDLLDDLNHAVARSAACALGQMGRTEARPMLARLLREGPSEDVIDAVSSVADEECIVLLGRIARSTPALSEAALNTLDSIDHHRASAIATAIRGRASAIREASAAHERTNSIPRDSKTAARSKPFRL
jgi:HEAT repeats